MQNHETGGSMELAREQAGKSMNFTLSGRDPASAASGSLTGSPVSIGAIPRGMPDR
jgi:hypothetical protein